MVAYEVDYAYAPAVTYEAAYMIAQLDAFAVAYVGPNIRIFCIVSALMD